MAGKFKTSYICQSCGYETLRWSGRCPECGNWNTLIEEVIEKKAEKQRSRVLSAKNIETYRLSEINSQKETRTETLIKEFDRVLGGGIVDGSIILVGGDPGIGKSTLMLQIANNLKDKKVLYVSGEESPFQIKMRSERLGYKPDNFEILAEIAVDVIDATVDNINPDLIVIDSIQTLYTPDLDSSPGTISQLRECTSFLTKVAKSKNIPVFIVGHITKDGSIAGPKVLEHMVDVVIQFEGERTHNYRILRSIKNRFGSTNEIGIFEMTENGLKEVANPSEVFLAQRNYGASGCVISSSIEGTRPILIEVQGLVTSSNYGVPQRTSMGFDYKRLNIIIAVLEKKLGLYLNKYDIFLNIAGGIRIDEPAIDLAASMSLFSSFKDIPIDSETVVLGEVGLAGEIRTISNIEKRINEADKLGFKKIIIPKNNQKSITTSKYKIKIVPVEKIKQAVEILV